eukprot:1176710-Prorocentrum_minimum.AAC.8
MARSFRRFTTVGVVPPTSSTVTSTMPMVLVTMATASSWQHRDRRGTVNKQDSSIHGTRAVKYTRSSVES